MKGLIADTNSQLAKYIDSRIPDDYEPGMNIGGLPMVAFESQYNVTNFGSRFARDPNCLERPVNSEAGEVDNAPDVAPNNDGESSREFVDANAESVEQNSLASGSKQPGGKRTPKGEVISPAFPPANLPLSSIVPSVAVAAKKTKGNTPSVEPLTINIQPAQKGKARKAKATKEGMSRATSNKQSTLTESLIILTAPTLYKCPITKGDVMYLLVKGVHVSRFAQHEEVDEMWICKGTHEIRDGHWLPLPKPCGEEASSQDSWDRHVKRHHFKFFADIRPCLNISDWIESMSIHPVHSDSHPPP
jgi:hypothetical protein